MASAEGPTRAHDRHGLRRPFSNWMKRLANLKTSNVDSESQDLGSKRLNQASVSRNKKANGCKDNPHPLSAPGPPADKNQISVSNAGSSTASHSGSQESVHLAQDGPAQASSAAVKSNSRPATLSTTGETAISDTTGSKAGTSATAARTDGGPNSTFSSPAPSVRSMATTLTTVQSVATSGHGNPASLTANGTSQGANNSNSNPSQLSHQFPASAHPAASSHLAPRHRHTTYNSATANNILTDDASIVTLASSSKRWRRNSADTNASMRALAPASMFGGSRESLPLSVLSGIVDPAASSTPNNATNPLPRPSLGGLASAERASIYSASAVAPVLSSDRNSYYANKQPTSSAAGGGGNGGGGGGVAADNISVRSGLAAHGRHDSSTNNSIGGGGVTSPLISQHQPQQPQQPQQQQQQGPAALNGTTSKAVPRSIGQEEVSSEEIEKAALPEGDSKVDRG